MRARNTSEQGYKAGASALTDASILIASCSWLRIISPARGATARALGCRVSGSRLQMIRGNSDMSLSEEVGAGLDGLGQLRALMSSGRKPTSAASGCRLRSLFYDETG
jgi:hypothetical protein